MTAEHLKKGETPVPADLEEAADEMAIRAFPEKKSYSTVIERVVDYNAVDRKNYHDGIIAGAKWQADNTPLPEDTVLFNKGVAEGKRLMMEEAVAIIQSRLSEIIGDAQPKPALRAELEELIKRIKE